jgi:hypothetical protein
MNDRRKGRAIVQPSRITEVHPPKILLLRGRAELDVVEGIPEEDLSAVEELVRQRDERQRG